MAKATGEHLQDLWRRKRVIEKTISGRKQDVKNEIKELQERVDGIEAEIDEIMGGDELVFDHATGEVKG